ncbi:MAG: hypothetical protein JSW55_06705 [Chloroflexota bacterium]|nr:MAG: hypothetical protein JSW55_06705 [Chloroflexota bacterium]
MRDGLINLSHLQWLTEIVDWQGKPVALVHIYSEEPEYGWVDAAGEGISAVDDVARAALVYLSYFQRTGDELALDLARYALNFVMALQADNGEYYNFVYDREGTINTMGRTSYRSWGWWAARAQWALATGYGVFRDVDPLYTAELEEAYLQGENALAQTIGPVGAYDSLHGQPIPAWLIGGGSDVSSLAMLGLATYYQVEPNNQTKQLLTNLANGVARYQLGGPGEYPYAAQPSMTSSTALWHAWGSHQVHALAWAGRLLDRQDWIEAAQRTADTLFVRFLVTDLVNEMLPLPQRRGQIAYGTEVVTSGFWSLYQATGDEQYARYAGLTASWLFGNNMAGVQMYDPETGRTFDGIDGPNEFRVNRNSGAESTIEGLYLLMLLDQDPVASQYLDYRAVESPPLIVEEVENGTKMTGDARYGQRGWTGEASFSNEHYYGLRAGDTVSVTVNIPADGNYLIYASHLRRGAPKPERLAEVIKATEPVIIDGQLDEWQTAQPLAVDSREQILRGGASWPGPEQASFILRWMWDDENLYVSARVFDPNHAQDDTGPSAWRGDTLWLYLDTKGSRKRVDVKLTLAETPDGPQVWTWTAGSFLPGAELAWREAEDGYIYEAALPLSSLNFLDPEDGKQIHFEAGKGFTGGFIDWTGLDPDTAANLAPLTFVESLSPEVRQGEIPEQSPGDIAFSVTLDGQETAVVPQSTSPDRDYLWLDPVFVEPVSLSKGEHALLLAYAGEKPDKEAVVDAFMIVPAEACKSLENAAGDTLHLCYDMESAAATWQEGR